MTTFHHLPTELRREIVMYCTLESVVQLTQEGPVFLSRENQYNSFTQTSASLRALILSDKVILANAFKTHPFELPARMTLDDSPSHFLTLCLKAVRTKERLWSADITQALTPRRHTSVSLPDIVHDNHVAGLHECPIPHPPFIFGDIIVYWADQDSYSLIIADLTDEERWHDIETEQIASLHCRMLDDNVTLRIAHVSWDGRYVPIVEDYDITEHYFKEVLHLRAPPIEGRSVLDPLIEGETIFIANGSSVYMFNVRDETGVKLELDGVFKILRIRAHPDMQSLIVEHVDVDLHSHVHIALIPIPHSTSKLSLNQPDLETTALWPVKVVSPIRKLSYSDDLMPALPLPPNYQIFSMIAPAGPQPSAHSDILEVVQYSSMGAFLYQVKHMAISPSSWEITSRVIQAPVLSHRPNTRVLRLQGIQMRYSDFATIFLVGERSGYGLYVLRTEKSGEMGWILLDISAVFGNVREHFDDSIWGFDVSSGRLFLYDRDELHLSRHKAGNRSERSDGKFRYIALGKRFRMATFNDLPAELRREILIESTLEDVVNLSQTSSSFRALIQSDNCILATAFYTHPFDLPAGNTPENPPSGFLSLCVQAVRVKQRLSKADITTTLQATHQRIVSGVPDLFRCRSGADPEPMPYPLFVFEHILVYYPGPDHSSMVIVDVRHENRRMNAPFGRVAVFHCQMMNNNSILRIACVCWEEEHLLVVNDYDVSGEEFRQVAHLVHLYLPGIALEKPLLEGSYVFVPVTSDCFICDLSDINRITGICLMLNSPIGGVLIILRLCMHPDGRSMIVEHLSDEDDIHFSVFPIPLSMPEIREVENPLTGGWSYAMETPVHTFAYRSGATISYNAHSYNSLFRTMTSAMPQPSSTSNVIEAVEHRLKHISGDELAYIEHTLVLPDTWEMRSTMLESPLPPKHFKVLKIRGTQMRYSDYAGLLMIGDTAGEGLYVLRTEKSGGMNWIHLDLSSVFEHGMRNVGEKIWGFDMSSGRLFVHYENELHVLYY
ncbi:hypothetical protein SISNIDRAFT_490672 [Sistotremastrum niveocremeum HHB9708]|uniref:F-box domain-containing protein n=1 Tax=Sistotremastrum niveocremeum HHB9708 TaxID=1314777 RepID=A0A164NN44_9AGAM|nr:hypothetical protein SISNIDRAFT_490672 [Sistotremastrum niveocremeum HHB9708]